MAAASGKVSRRTKKLRDTEESKSEQSGLVYIGHLPHGFYEDQLTGYFSQFGTVTKVKVARNKKVSVQYAKW